MTEQDIDLYLREVIDTMNDGLIIVSPDGIIMKVNDALLRMTGFSKDELLNKPCSVLGCDACRIVREQSDGHWCGLFERKKESRKNCHIIGKNGNYLHVLKNASLLRDDEDNILGAVETVTDISELDRKELKIRELSRKLQHEENGFCGFVGHSPAMQKVYTLLGKAARSDAPVIIYGESGTGKELAAQAIHEMSPRADKPFVQLNCAALNESLLESELFGHVKGAFTGAYRHRQGRFEEAADGSIFLDEIGDVPLPIQVKLLRVLETRSFERVGENINLSMEARLITATNQDLNQLVQDKQFREDFFFRINVIPVHLPPLRARKEDLPLLVDHFISVIDHLDHSEGPTPETMRKLMEYQWPGNVRELKSALEYAAVVKDSGPIQPEHLPPQINSVTADCCPCIEPPVPAAEPDEKQELINALNQAGGNKSKAAKLLGVSRGTIHNRMRKHSVQYRLEG
ncbi:sigma-54 interaction domain-containing protein [Maridesulfovibrio salexigens]|uniref:PAS modulated sigma54 specific transcriptional regulator, Fis family n=1 Tax=Maridesulfovibrio salexigens (strain ATCC 14822 / DSM 2638 / NCIMB 8403 / VKM B-1763) TaxID=526222 RepID=C6BZ70_MARSD|nr:sigma-54-dependent Fis family transcriptional regulator [Maridesulfovibrio salexigens]ACS78894.1 PAS modulated sigma54 specific transcriptional regulator, Fis family [Maridesulfovibrio salexigens DSM 2638]